MLVQVHPNDRNTECEWLQHQARYLCLHRNVKKRKERKLLYVTSMLILLTINQRLKALRVNNYICCSSSLFFIALLCEAFSFFFFLFFVLGKTTGRQYWKRAKQWKAKRNNCYFVSSGRNEMLFKAYITVSWSQRTLFISICSQILLPNYVDNWFVEIKMFLTDNTIELIEYICVYRNEITLLWSACICIHFYWQVVFKFQSNKTTVINFPHFFYHFILD